MTRDQAIDLLLGRFGNNVDPTLPQSIINEMVFVQETMLEQDVLHPWFLMSDATDLTANAQGELTLPADFIGWNQDIPLFTLVGSTYVPASRQDFGPLESATSYNGVHWEQLGDMIYLLPKEAHNVRLWYYKRDASLAGAYGGAGNVENNWLKYAADWFLGEVGLLIADQYLKHKAAYKTLFTQQVARGRARTEKRNIEMNEVLKRRVMGG